MSTLASIASTPWVSRALAPAGWLYGALAARRRTALTSVAQALDRPVISVGNITCGGTGKTPMVEMLVRDLQGLGLRPAILSRGYGAAAAPGEAGAPHNDEYLVLRANLPDVPHLQGRDRVALGRQAVREGADAIVLDDGFQHVRLHRDLDIVLIDALSPFGTGRVLPAGLLREPLSTLRLAGLLGITRADLAPPRSVETLCSYLRARFRGVPQARLVNEPVAWLRLDGESAPPDALRGRRVLAFCGIGNPASFRRQLGALGVEAADFVAFRDHQAFSPADLERLAARARSAGVEEVVMTQKDAVKIRSTGATASWRYLRIASRIVRGQEDYDRALRRALDRGARHAS
jgi:tetraacyldisaccharide 4'-kinase